METVEILNYPVEVKADFFNKVKPDKMMKKEYYLILLINVNILRLTDIFQGSEKKKNRLKSLWSQDQWVFYTWSPILIKLNLISNCF